MNNGLLGTKEVTQIGIIVKDIEKTMEAYSQFLGLEKPNWIITDIVEKANTLFMGQPTRARAKLAFFKVGQSLEIELIEPDNEPSTWREFLDEHGEGVHHIAFVVDGMADKIINLDKNNMKLVQKGDYEGGRYAYVDTIKDLKVILELLENDK